MNQILDQAAEKISQSAYTLAFTGAGISVESGIPPFRGENGLWNKYDPKVLEINYFLDHGAESWKYIREIFYDYFGKSEPNAGHKALADMEKMGYLHAIVTQNIDNLHHMAGNKTVHEFHGSSSRLVCSKCQNVYPVTQFDLKDIPPVCPHDHQLLKPDFVFFGEGIPAQAWDKSFESAEKCEVCLVIGSTGEVVPASYVPQRARERGAFIIEVNPEPSQFTNTITDLHLVGKAGDILPKLAARLKEIKGQKG